jgi:hypothetical protein
VPFAFVKEREGYLTRADRLRDEEHVEFPRLRRAAASRKFEKPGISTCGLRNFVAARQVRWAAGTVTLVDDSHAAPPVLLGPLAALKSPPRAGSTNFVL